MRRLARPILTELVERIEDDVYLAVSNGGRVMYVDHFLGMRRVRVTIRLGQRLYLHSTATGKLAAAYDPRLRAAALEGPLPKLTEYTVTDPAVLAADFDAIAEQGYSVSRQESFEGIVGVAVPIWNRDGSMPAAIHVSLLVGQALDDRLPVIIEALQEAARAISDTHGPIAEQLGAATNGAGPATALKKPASKRPAAKKPAAKKPAPRKAAAKKG